MRLGGGGMEKRLSLSWVFSAFSPILCPHVSDSSSLFYSGHAREPSRCSPLFCFFFFLRNLFFLVIPVPVISLVPVFLIPISFMSSLLSLSFSCHLTLLILSSVTLWPETQNAQGLYGEICSTIIKCRWLCSGERPFICLWKAQSSSML